jgi:tetratricopeptide (TPR) repeat protein
MAISSSMNGKNDEFVSEVTSFFDVLAKRSGLLVGVGIGVLVVAGVLAFVASHNEEKSDAGRSALYLAEKSLDTQEKALAKTLAPAAAPEVPTSAKDKAVPKKPVQDLGADAIAFQKMDVDTQFADSVAKLKATANDYSSTRAGFDAMLILGKLYLNHGDSAKAADWFSKSTQHAPASLDRALAWNSLGYAYENDSKYKEAITAFDQALGTGDAAIKGDVLLSKARVASEMNDTATAKSVYETISKQLPNTEYSKQADLFKSLLK